MSKLKEAADLLEYYLNENIPAQETIGAFQLVDAIREADKFFHNLAEIMPDLQDLTDCEAIRKVQELRKGL